MYLSLIPNVIVKQFNLHYMVHNDNFVYKEIRKEVYGLIQAGNFVDKKLT